MIRPGGACQPALQGLLQLPVGPLHQAVALRVVCHCCAVLYPQLAAQGIPDAGGELGPSIRSDDCRDAELDTQPLIRASVQEEAAIS